MNTKLTLSVQQDVIDAAKEYAKKRSRSLSNIVEEYLKSLSKTTPLNNRKELSKIVKELKGSLSLPKDFKSYKELLEDALIEKYLK